MRNKHKPVAFLAVLMSLLLVIGSLPMNTVSVRADDDGYEEGYTGIVYEPYINDAQAQTLVIDGEDYSPVVGDNKVVWTGHEIQPTIGVRRIEYIDDVATDVTELDNNTDFEVDRWPDDDSEPGSYDLIVNIHYGTEEDSTSYTYEVVKYELSDDFQIEAVEGNYCPDSSVSLSCNSMDGYSQISGVDVDPDTYATFAANEYEKENVPVWAWQEAEGYTCYVSKATYTVSRYRLTIGSYEYHEETEADYNYSYEYLLSDRVGGCALYDDDDSIPFELYDYRNEVYFSDRSGVSSLAIDGEGNEYDTYFNNITYPGDYTLQVTVDDTGAVLTDTFSIIDVAMAGSGNNPDFTVELSEENGVYEYDGSSVEPDYTAYDSNGDEINTDRIKCVYEDEESGLGNATMYVRWCPDGENHPWSFLAKEVEFTVVDEIPNEEEESEYVLCLDEDCTDYSAWMDDGEYYAKPGEYVMPGITVYDPWGSSVGDSYYDATYYKVSTDAATGEIMLDDDDQIMMTPVLDLAPPDEDGVYPGLYYVEAIGEGEEGEWSCGHYYRVFEIAHLTQDETMMIDVEFDEDDYDYTGDDIVVQPSYLDISEDFQDKAYYSYAPAVDIRSWYSDDTVGPGYVTVYAKTYWYIIPGNESIPIFRNDNQCEYDGCEYSSYTMVIGSGTYAIFEEEEVAIEVGVYFGDISDSYEYSDETISIPYSMDTRMATDNDLDLDVYFEDEDSEDGESENSSILSYNGTDGNGNLLFDIIGIGTTTVTLDCDSESYHGAESIDVTVVKGTESISLSSDKDSYFYPSDTEAVIEFGTPELGSEEFDRTISVDNEEVLQLSSVNDDEGTASFTIVGVGEATVSVIFESEHYIAGALINITVGEKEEAEIWFASGLDTTFNYPTDETFSLTYSCGPDFSGDDNFEITVTSDNDNVVTFTEAREGGYLDFIIIGGGTATITLSAESDHYYGTTSIDITVDGKERVEVTLDCDRQTYVRDEEFEIDFEVSDVILSDGNFTWRFESEDEEVVSFDNDATPENELGQVFDAQNLGTTTITCYVESDNYFGSASVEITVKQALSFDVTVSSADFTYGSDDLTIDVGLGSGYSEVPVIEIISGEDVISLGNSSYGAGHHIWEPDILNAGTVVIAVTYEDNTYYGRQTKTITIAPKELTVTGVAIADKTYDGNTNATITNVAVDGLVGTDTFTLASGATAAFDDKNVGTNKTVTVTGLASDNSNYTFSSSTLTTTGNITAKPVKITGLKGVDKEYDGTKTATIDFSEAVLTGKVSTDTLSVMPAGEFADAAPGENKTVNITNLMLVGADKDNYTVDTANSQSTVTASIAKASTDVTITPPTSCTYGDLIFLLDVSVANEGTDGEFTYSSSDTGVLNVSRNGSVAITGAGTATIMVGYDSDEYTGEGEVTITVDPKELTVTNVTVENKEYDGGVNATIANIAVNGLVGDDTFVLASGAKAEFVDKNVGANKDAVVTGLASGDSNYTLSSSTFIVFGAAITAKPVKITGIKAKDKEYDGTKTATLDLSDMTLTGKVDEDDLAVTITGAFADTNVGKNKTVSINFALTGDDMCNYTVDTANSATSATASITKASTEISFSTPATFTYGDSEYQINARLSNEEAGGVFTYTSSNENVIKFNENGAMSFVGAGTATITVAYESNGYEGEESVELTVNPRRLIVTGITIENKDYDGTTNATIKDITVSGLVGDDTFTLASGAKAEFADKKAGGDKNVNITGLASSDSNYVLASSTFATKGRIVPAVVTVRGTFTAKDKYYDDKPDAQIVAKDVVLGNIVSGDDISAEFTGYFDDDIIEDNKSVTLLVNLVGADKDNYLLGLISAGDIRASILDPQSESEPGESSDSGQGTATTDNGSGATETTTPSGESGEGTTKPVQEEGSGSGQTTEPGGSSDSGETTKPSDNNTSGGTSSSDAESTTGQTDGGNGSSGNTDTSEGNKNDVKEDQTETGKDDTPKEPDADGNAVTKTENEDGSVTTTTENVNDGSKTVVTENADGSTQTDIDYADGATKSITETADGATKVEVKDTDGTTGSQTVKTDEAGNVTDRTTEITNADGSIVTQSYSAEYDEDGSVSIEQETVYTAADGTESVVKEVTGISIDTKEVDGETITVETVSTVRTTTDAEGNTEEVTISSVTETKEDGSYVATTTETDSNGLTTVSVQTYEVTGKRTSTTTDETYNDAGELIEKVTDKAKISKAGTETHKITSTGEDGTIKATTKDLADGSSSATITIKNDDGSTVKVDDNVTAEGEGTRKVTETAADGTLTISDESYQKTSGLWDEFNIAQDNGKSLLDELKDKAAGNADGENTVSKSVVEVAPDGAATLKEVEFTGATAILPNVVASSTGKQYPVEIISKGALSKVEAKKIVLGDNVKTISKGAFDNLSANTKKLVISSSSKVGVSKSLVTTKSGEASLSKVKIRITKAMSTSDFKKVKKKLIKAGIPAGNIKRAKSF